MKPIVLTGSKANSVNEHCLYALDIADSGVRPSNPRMFEAGTAAHACMEAMHRKAIDTNQPVLDMGLIQLVCSQVVERLAMRGPVYRGRQQPPITPVNAIEGADIARWYAYERPFDLTAIPELELACDEEWRPVTNGSVTTAYSGIVDTLTPPTEEEVSDEDVCRVLTVSDYKTDWPAGQARTTSAQLRLYACLAHAHYRAQGVDAIRLRIVNLRTQQAFEHLLRLDDDGTATLNRWRSEFGLTRSVAQPRPGGRPAAPGKHCHGCWWLGACKHAPQATDNAARFAVVSAERDRLKHLLELQTAEHPIDIPGGRVGYALREERSVRPDAPARMVALWRQAQGQIADPTDGQWCADNADLIGLVAALKPTVSNVSALVAAVCPDDRSRREGLKTSLLAVETVARFGVWDVRSPSAADQIAADLAVLDSDPLASLEVQGE